MQLRAKEYAVYSPTYGFYVVADYFCSPGTTLICAFPGRVDLSGKNRTMEGGSVGPVVLFCLSYIRWASSFHRSKGYFFFEREL